MRVLGGNAYLISSLDNYLVSAACLRSIFVAMKGKLLWAAKLLFICKFKLLYMKISGSPSTSVAPFIEGGEHAEGKKFVTP